MPIAGTIYTVDRSFLRHYVPVAPDILNRFEFFRALPAEAFKAICESGRIESLPRRKLVYQPGDKPLGLGLLIDGRLQAINLTLDGREAGLYFVESGDIFGELAAVDGMPYKEYMLSLMPSMIVMIPLPVAHRYLIEGGGAPSVAIMRVLASRLRESMEQHALLAMQSPLQRVSAQIIRLTRQSTQAQMEIHAPTHQEIAIMVNVTRETVTRIFLQLQKRGVIQRDGQTLKILDPDFLLNTAKGNESES